jgi:hypothetical protein
LKFKIGDRAIVVTNEWKYLIGIGEEVEVILIENNIYDCEQVSDKSRRCWFIDKDLELIKKKELF